MFDEEIKKSVVDQLYWDGRIDASKVQVTVHEGIVQLEGEVPSKRAKDAAFENTIKIPYVRVADNNLIVTAKTENIPYDQVISKAIMADPDIEHDKVFVEEDNGSIILNGNVDAYWKKIHLMNIAADFAGKSNVKNMITIAPSSTVSDENIATTIVNALRRNSTVNAEEIDVIVDQGKVILSGETDSALKTEAESVAGNTPDVVDIENRIMIKGEEQGDSSG